MPWSLTIPNASPDRFDDAVEATIERNAARLAEANASASASLAALCVKEMLRVWDVSQIQGRTFGAILAGHANPGGNAPTGALNDAITIKIWRSS